MAIRYSFNFRIYINIQQIEKTVASSVLTLIALQDKFTQIERCDIRRI